MINRGKELYPASDRFVAIDVEPGGTSRTIGNIGLVEVVDGRLTSEPLHLQFNALAPPGEEVPPHENMPTPDHGFAAVYPQMKDFIADSPVVAYNSSYDQRALKKLMAENVDNLPPDITDVRMIAKRVWPIAKTGYALESLVLELGIVSLEEVAQRRRVGRMALRSTGKRFLCGASDDAWACAQVVCKAMETMGTATLPDLLAHAKNLAL